MTSDVSVEVADFDWPHGPDERASETVTYTNDTDRDVRLQLGLEDVTGDDGGRVPSRLLELDDHSVTVRAHDTATVEVDARGDVGGLRDSAYGGIGGRIVATGRIGHDKVRVTTAVGMYLELKMVDVTVRAVDRNGDPATSGNLDITDLHQPHRALYLFTGEDVTLRLRAGSHFLSSFIRTTEDDGTFSYSHLVDPDRRFTQDTTLVLDARDARPVTVQGDRPMAIRSGSFGVQRTWDGWVVGDSLFAERDPEFFATPTDRVDIGDFTYGTYLRTFDPAVPSEESEYVYNLAFTEEDRVPSDLSYRVSDRRLARVDESWYAQRQPWEPEGGPASSSTTARVPFTRRPGPGRRTRFPDGLLLARRGLAAARLQRRVPQTSGDVVRPGAHLPRRRSPGDRVVQAADPDRDGGQPRRQPGPDRRAAGFARRLRVPHVAGLGGGAVRRGRLPRHRRPHALAGRRVRRPQPVPVRHRRHRRRHPRAHRGGHAGTYLAPRVLGAGPRHGESLHVPDQQAEGRDHGCAAPGPAAVRRPRRRAQPGSGRAGLPGYVTFHGQDGYDPGRLRSFMAKVTFDQVDPIGETPLEDYAWTEVPVERRGDRWVALVDNTAGAGRTASLWITAEDAHGTRTEQFTVSLYGVQ